MAELATRNTLGVEDSMVQAFMTLAPILPELMDQKDMSIWAAAPEKILMFDVYGRSPRPAVPGDPLTAGGTPELVLRTKQKVARDVPQHVYGVACKTIALPLNQHAIGLTYSVEDKDILRHALEQLTTEMSHVSHSSHQITLIAQRIVQTMETLVETFKQTEYRLAEIDRIGEIVGKIAKNSRYISINALVEANRAGEHGRGFALVATEMQRLSVQTQKLITEVNQNLRGIHHFFSELQDLVKAVEGDVKSQSGSSQAIAGSIAEVSQSVHEIEQIAQRL